MGIKLLQIRSQGLKTEFDRLKAEHQTAKEATNRRKAELESEREKVLDKAGVGIFEREDAKIVKKPDGTTQVYHGGLGKGDGLGHGHTVLDQFGAVTYDRKAFEERGSQNFKGSRAEKIAELKARREAWKQSSQKGWTELLHGTIEDHEVTFKLGLGKNQDQTLIADGLIETEDEFRGKGGQRNHDHYGPDNKYSDGAKRIEEIRKYLSRYTGPGH